MKRALIVLCLCTLLAVTVVLADKITDRVERSTEVYNELINAPDAGVPEKLLEDCRCVAVLPGVKKAGLGFGGRHGKGVVSCKNDAGQWSPIGFMTLSGGSWGLQIGGSSTDLVLFVMSEKGVQSLVKSQFKIGADAAAAAGPKGRSAEVGTDYRLGADILAYARTKGLFAGIALDGASLRSDQKAVKRFYGADIGIETIIFDHKVPKMPTAAKQFLKVLP